MNPSPQQRRINRLNGKQLWALYQWIKTKKANLTKHSFKARAHEAAAALDMRITEYNFSSVWQVVKELEIQQA